jgi:hypothetical protein
MSRRLIVLLALSLAPRLVAAQLKCCYQITGIDTRTGVVSAAEPATRATLQFQVRDRLLLAKLRANQQVYVDLAARQVGLDARQACCAIVGTPSVSATARAPAPAAAAPAPAPAAPAASAAAAGPQRTTPRAAISTNLPSIAYGTPRPATTPRQRAQSRFETQSVTAAVGGRTVTGGVLHLRGVKAVEQAPGLPDGARRLLVMATRRVPRDQSDHYVVNLELAQQWIAEHAVPDDIKPTEPKEKKCDNWYDSWDCAGQAVSDEWQRAFDHAVDEWDRATKKLADAWETTQGCFTERTLTLPNIPVQFGIKPSMKIDLAQSAGRGSAKGTVGGSVGFGVPMQADLTARLDLFYIPCLPFAVRPKALAGGGVLTVGEAFEGKVTASGAFKKTFTIPPTGGPVIPIQIFPIVIAGVPVSEVDVSAYIEGNIEVSADGQVEGSFQLENSHPTEFSFSCDGKGCSAKSNRLPAASTSSQGAQIEGRVSVKPAVYTAIQLNFNYEALSARAGPQPYMLGVASGCGAVAASQSSGGASTNQSNYLLSGDLDWGVELRAEALVLKKIVGSPYVTRVLHEKHVWFRDLAPGGSTALAAVVTPPAQVEPGKPALYRIRMPTCYPYPDRVQYRVSWTGNATPAAPTGCTWQAGAGTCQFDPARDLLVSLTWPAAGSYALTVTPVRDAHGRSFAPAPAPTQVAVAVTPSP